MATSRPAGWSTAGPTRRNSASGFWKRRWGIEVDSVHDRFGVGVAIQILPAAKPWGGDRSRSERSEEHTSELQSLMRNSYAVLCLKNKRHETTSLKNTSQKGKHID